MNEDKSTEDTFESALHPSLLVRMLLWTIGSLALVLGVIGIFLPGLPTTPFVLLAAACYARASEPFYRWLTGNPTFGPLIVEWRTHHSIPFRIKIVAITLMCLTISLSIWTFSGLPWIQVLLASVGIATSFWLWRIPSRDRPVLEDQTDTAS
ncbi:MAG: YbaN family protein [Sulfuritalea sp.]|nr:YbaN family protein [Sulfuritalea sp.]